MKTVAGRGGTTFPIIAVVVLVLALPTIEAGASARATDWVQRYDPAGLLDRAWAVATSPDGTRVFVTGQSTARVGSRDYATIAYDASTGGQLWVARYNGPGAASYDSAWDIAVAPDGGRVYVTGGSGSYPTTFTTVAYDAADGTQLWVAQYAGGTATQIEVSPDGTRVYVAGSDGGRWHTIAYDAATGAQIWIVQFVEDNLHAMTISRDGARLFLTGDFYSYDGSYQNYATVAYDTATGLPLWTAFYDDPGHGDDHTRAIGVSPDGSRVFITGMAHPGDKAIFNTIAYDAATGAQLWLSTYDNNGTGGHVANALGVSEDGALVFVAGSSWGTNSTDYATVAYDASTGAQSWVARYNGPVNGSDAAYALGVDPAGGLLYVTGRSTGDGTSYDYATVAYAVLTGGQVWESRYDNLGHGDDMAQDLAVGVGGSVFVTGGSLGEGGHSDYATVGRIP